MKRKKLGVSVPDARKFILTLDDVTEGRKYGHHAFLIHGRFFARFRDDDTVLVLALASIDDREVLMQMDPKAFFFTDHYRDYPAVLIRLAAIPPALLRDVVTDSWRHVSSLPPSKPRVRRKSR